MNIYFLQFQSKINRIVKTYPDLAGYGSFIINDIGPKDATNFPYRDGISTQETYKFNTNKMPDYAIIVDDEGVVRSRWYVEETYWMLYGQWKVRFRRDVLADYKEQVLNATALIEKATVRSVNDPAIYNQEPIIFNQIKKGETLLKDKSATAWLVGYLSSDNAAEKTYTASNSNEIKRTVAGIANWEYYPYTTNTYTGTPREMTYNVKFQGQSNSIGFYLAQMAFSEEGAAPTDTSSHAIGYKVLNDRDRAYSEEQRYNAIKNTFVVNRTKEPEATYNAAMARLPDMTDLTTTTWTQIGEFHTPDDVGRFRALDGSCIYDSVGLKTYKVEVVEYPEGVERYTPVKGTSIYDKIKQFMLSVPDINANNITNTNDVYVKYSVVRYSISLTEVSSDIVSAEITASRLVLNDAPYTLFAIPYGDVAFKESGTDYVSDPASALAIARQISLELMSSGALYDLQLLPYCPRQDLIGTNEIDLTGATENTDYELIKDANDVIKSFMIFAKNSSFTFDVDEQIEVDPTPAEFKTAINCDMYRLCSPNYNGVFQFNAAKNGGVNYFNVDCTYRPLNPYIHVNPNFKALYGGDYDDARGLICSGDFSMPAATDRWLTYEAQNKNYQASFDRTIEHIEIEQKYQRINQIAGAIGGIGSGSVAGGVIGGVPGAIAGGALSAAGGVADILMSEQMRSEQIRYQKDQFALNLENIKALPNSLAKVGAFTKNNKIFPFLEYYTCTDVEKEAFRHTMIYDGMTVDRIGKIADFITENSIQYIKARLIRCDIHDDHHIVDLIAAEMEKGAYYDSRND